MPVEAHRTTPSRTPRAPNPAPAPKSGWRELFRTAPFTNAAVVLAIVIGFFHGWLKLKIRHPVATFLFDLPLLAALAMAFSRLPSAAAWFPPGRASQAMKCFYGVIAVWFALSMVLPHGAPFLVALAAVRGWVFATLMFGLGYHIVGSHRQLHGYFLLIILLSAITSLYATRQTLEEVEAMRALDPYFELMTRGQGYVDEDGRHVLRRFSTFISSGAFGGTMAVSLLFLSALLTDRSVGRLEKLLLVGLALVIGWGMALSGARSAVLALGLGLLVIAWHRRLSLGMLWLGGAFTAGLLLAVQATEGGVLHRLATLDLDAIWGRFYVVWAPGLRYLLESGLLGGGLGKAGVGYPMSLAHYLGPFEVWGVDGDLGKTMAEMGIVGVGVVAWLLIAGLLDGTRILLRRRLDRVGTLALGAVCAFLIAAITFPIGSPFIGIPLGVLTWFFLGAVIRLDQLEPTGNPHAAPSAPSPPPPKRFLYR
ncbi:MAG: hypothetical protein KF833_14485 [Verrucomicrobiae bacterium]|nr:hypothetical protein [Verrucomicrobiae bacterium]